MNRCQVWLWILYINYFIFSSQQTYGVDTIIIPISHVKTWGTERLGTILTVTRLVTRRARIWTKGRASDSNSVFLAADSAASHESYNNLKDRKLIMQRKDWDLKYDIGGPGMPRFSGLGDISMSSCIKSANMKEKYLLSSRAYNHGLQSWVKDHQLYMDGPCPYGLCRPWKGKPSIRTYACGFITAVILSRGGREEQGQGSLPRALQGPRQVSDGVSWVLLHRCREEGLRSIVSRWAGVHRDLRLEGARFLQGNARRSAYGWY